MRDMGGIIVEAARLTSEAVPLLRAIGRNGSRLITLTERLVQIPGSPPSLLNPPRGCRFNPRCPSASDICRETVPGVTALAAGANHSLFLKTDGTLWGMGYNSSGQLGDGTTNNQGKPVKIGLLQRYATDAAMEEKHPYQRGATSGKKVAVVGATGAVGHEILSILAEREFPVSDVVALNADPCH